MLPTTSTTSSTTERLARRAEPHSLHLPRNLARKAGQGDIVEIRDMLLE